MFDYPIPKNKELLKMYPDSNWYIKSHTKTLLDVIFMSHTNRHRSYYIQGMNKLPSSRKKYMHQNMAQAGIRIVRYYRDNPQQFNHNPENIYGFLLVVAWRIFVIATKTYMDNPGYMATPKVLITKYGELLYDSLVDEIENPIGRYKKSKKRRSESRHFEYLASLE